MSSEPPPTYSQNAGDILDDNATLTEPQILIVPHSNGVGFQKGYLGADGERAAVEGELHIKGVNSRPWKRVYAFFSYGAHQCISYLEVYGL